METTKSIEKEIKSRTQEDGFIYPDYDKYCIKNLPHSFLSLLDVGVNKDFYDLREQIVSEDEDIENVIFILIDSMGYTQLLNHIQQADSSLVEDVVSCSNLFPLTSVFPATTTTALASLHTGAEPKEHGILGCRVYLPEMGFIANMITFSSLGNSQYNELNGYIESPQDFLGVDTLHETLHRNDISSYIITKHSYINKGMSHLFHPGSEVVPFLDLSDMFTQTRKTLHEEGKKVLFSYWNVLDSISHIYGAESEEYHTHLNNIFYYFNKFANQIPDRIAEKTAIVMSADHGQVNIPEVVEVLDDRELQDLLLVPPVGEYRASFLYSMENERLHSYLGEKHPEKFEVLDSQKALKNGLFGTKRQYDERKVRGRIGHSVLLSRPKYAFHYSFLQSDRPFIDKAHHGGLTEEEMLVPVISGKLSNFK